MESRLWYVMKIMLVEIPLYPKSTPRINNNVVSDSKHRIDRTDQRFWNGTDKSARTFFILYIFRRLGRAVLPRGTTVGGSP
jgi:hypothetical protein